MFLYVASVLFQLFLLPVLELSFPTFIWQQLLCLQYLPLPFDHGKPAYSLKLDLNPSSLLILSVVPPQ